MTLLVDWYQANKLSLNVHKTVLIKFWPNNAELTIKIDEVTVKNESCTQFLGITLDDKLSWDHHANALLNKLKMNKRLLSNARNLPSQNLLKVYCTLVYSHIIYGLAVWGSMIMLWPGKNFPEY